MVSFTVFKGSKNGTIIQSTTTREIRPDEVLVKVTHSGLCGTDEHHLDLDMVLGHEGSGTVEQLGRDVTTLSVGDHVGWGYVHNSCGTCEQCLTGHEQLCQNNEMYGSANLDQGSFATYGVWKAAFLFKIPDSMTPADAAPLMCGGATVFHALHSFGVRSGERVGVIGVGGLGHLAIQFAAKMGCEVVVFSSTESKKEEAMRLGATQFIATKGLTKLDIGKPLNRLLVTTSSPPEWKLLLPIMAPQGVIFPLTVNSGNLEMPYQTIIDFELRIQGSVVAPRQVHREMIEFAARNSIKPIIEQFPLSVDGITEAMDKLRAGHMRYRGVLAA